MDARSHALYGARNSGSRHGHRLRGKVHEKRHSDDVDHHPRSSWADRSSFDGRNGNRSLRRYDETLETYPVVI